MDKFLKNIHIENDTGVLVGKHLAGFIFANDLVCELFGYTKEELIKFDTLTYLMEQDDPDGNMDKYLSVLNGALQQETITHNFIRKDKTIFQAEVDMTCHDDVMIMKFDNIVETHQKADDQEDQSLQKVIKSYQKKDSGVLIISTKGGIVYANQTAYEAFGYSKNEMHGINAPRHFTHKKSLAKLTGNSIKVFTGFASEASFPVTFKKKDESGIRANLTITKHKEDGMKYLVLQLENIAQAEHLLTAE